MFNKVFVIIIIELLVVFNAWAQDKKDENFTYVPNNEVLFLIETDAVKQMVINRTLMSGIKNYKTIFSNNIEIMTLGPYVQDKGYAVYWLIKDNRLYLADIIPYSCYELIWSRPFFENYSARRFDVEISENSLDSTIIPPKVMFADWVSGVYYVYSYGNLKQTSPFRKIVFDKGMVVSFESTQLAMEHSLLRKDPFGRVYEGPSMTYSENGRIGYKNSKGEVVVAPQFSEAPTELKYDYTPVMKNGKFGYINKQGKTVIDFRFDKAYDFGVNQHPDLALVNIGSNYANSDDEWKRGMLIPCYLSGFQGMIDKRGKVVIPIKYTQIGLFNEGIVPVTTTKADMSISPKGWTREAPITNGIFGFIDARGRTVAKPAYDYVEFDSPCGYFVVGLNFKYGVIDNKTGKLVVPLEYTLKEAIAKSTELSDKKYK